jgi:hypothetical protein
MQAADKPDQMRLDNSVNAFAWLNTGTPEKRKANGHVR